MSAELIPSGVETPAPVRDPRPTILLVGTNRRLQRALHDCLTPAFACLSARNNHLAGVKQLPTLAPDLIVIDASHRDMDPTRTLEALRGLHDTRKAAMLVLDSPATPAACARWLDAGADDVVRMPFLAPELLARVRNLLAARALATELAEARQAADQALSVKHDFLCVMSHELKTPLATILLQLNAIKRDLEGAPSREVLAGLDRIWRSSRRMHHLAETMLAWARLDGGSPELSMERFDLSAVASSIAAEFRTHAAQKSITLELRSPPGGIQVCGVERLVHLVVHDMLSRAVQVTPSGSVEIAVGGAQNETWVSVRDGGEPLSPEELRMLFDPFRSTAQVHQRGGAGSGLELHAVRDIARAFRGELALRPSPGPGNTLVLTLPVAPSPSLAQGHTGVHQRPTPHNGGGHSASLIQE
jgi:signal transduction histidine kinase